MWVIMVPKWKTLAVVKLSAGAAAIGPRVLRRPIKVPIFCAYSSSGFSRNTLEIPARFLPEGLEEATKVFADL